jgi:hypothetical protein
VDIKINHVRDLITQGVIDVAFVPTIDMMADLLTKPLFGTKFTTGRTALGIREVNTSNEKATCRRVGVISKHDGIVHNYHTPKPSAHTVSQRVADNFTRKKE